MTKTAGFHSAPMGTRITANEDSTSAKNAATRRTVASRFGGDSLIVADDAIDCPPPSILSRIVGARISLTVFVAWGRPAHTLEERKMCRA